MKLYGKEKCRILKQIRAEIARQNDIEWVVEECTHKGNCRGTCPRCEAEVRQLERALARREALGKTVAVVGISAGLSLSVTGCVNPLSSTTDGLMPTLAGGAGVPVITTNGDGSVAEQETCEVLMGDIAMEVDGELAYSEDVETAEVTAARTIPIETDPDETDEFVPIPGEEVVLGGVPALPEDWEDDILEGEPACPEDYDSDGESPCAK